MESAGSRGARASTASAQPIGRRGSTREQSSKHRKVVKSLILIAAVTLIGIEKVVTFLVMLSVLIVLHEFGHFIVARRIGVRVNEFALGFGPRLLGGRARAAERSTRCAPFRSAASARWRARTARPPRPSSSGTFAADARTGGEAATFKPSRRGARLAIIARGAVRELRVVLCDLARRRAGLRRCRAISRISAAGRRRSSCRIARGRSPGMRAGDRIVAIDDVPVTSGKKLVDTIHGSLGKRLDLVYAAQRRSTARSTSRRRPVRAHGRPRTSGCIGFSPMPAYRARRLRRGRARERRAVRRHRRSDGREHRLAGDAVREVRAAGLRADRHGAGRSDGAGLGLGTVLLARGDDLVCARALQPACRFRRSTAGARPSSSPS